MTIHSSEERITKDPIEKYKIYQNSFKSRLPYMNGLDSLTHIEFQHINAKKGHELKTNDHIF